MGGVKARVGTGRRAAGGLADLPLQSFIDRAREALAAEPPPAAELVASIRRQAAERLKALSQQSRATFDSLLDLYDWGRGELAPQERDAVLAQLKPTADDVGSWDLARLHRAHTQVERLGITSAVREGVLGAWLEQRALDETALAGLADDPATRAAEVAWLCVALDGTGATADRFSVTWTGLLQVPATGTYTFSTTPINVNFKSHGRHENLDGRGDAG